MAAPHDHAPKIGKVTASNCYERFVRNNGKPQYIDFQRKIIFASRDLRAHAYRSTSMPNFLNLKRGISARAGYVECCFYCILCRLMAALYRASKTMKKMTESNLRMRR